MPGIYYYVRYGMPRHVGRFVAEAASTFGRGEAVVVRTPRGHELGEVLAEAPPGTEASAPLLRPACPADMERARHAEADRPRRLSACEKLLGDGVWPLELIDVEPLLDEARTVVYYLGPHHLDTAGLGQAFRLSCGFDPIFQPIGLDEPDEGAGGGCGSCGEGGGCGSGCGEGGGGCSGCAVKDLVAKPRAAVFGR